MTNKLPKLLALATFSVALFTILSTSSASAATINVSTNDVVSTNDADCTLREAIENINTQTNAVNTDCAAGDGSTDTIIIPSGNIILEADLPQITTSMIIQGAGMGQTVIDGGGAWYTIRASGGPTYTLTVKGLSIVGFVGQAIGVDGTNVQVQRVQIDGTNSAASGALSGISIMTNQIITALIEDTYIHDITATSDQTGIVGGVLMLNKNSIDITIRRTTVSNISSVAPSAAAAMGIIGLTGLFDGEGTPADFVIDYENITVTNVNSANALLGLGFAGAVIGGTSHISGSISNSTVTNLNSTVNIISGAAVGISPGASGPADGYIVNVSVQNLLVSAGGEANCSFVDASTQYGGTGTATVNVNSQGGNLSDDASCAGTFTQPTDQNNVAALAASLLPLADNGGDVPTMALKEGSPAVDSGITVSGLTTDARQAARPQGSAYDSGAYESPYTKPAAVLAKSGQGIMVSIMASIGLIVFAFAGARLRHYAVDTKA